MPATTDRGLETRAQDLSEIYLPLSTERVLAQERRELPDWEPGVPDIDALRREVVREEVVLTRSDHFICPSPAVQDDLITNFGVSRDRTSLVPYGVHRDWLSVEARPERGQILFVGEPDLRKGIHYLALAAERLRTRGHAYEFRVAGSVNPAVRQQPVCRYLHFLGRVPRDRIQEEFATADLFVLPTLSEGFGVVQLESLACGVPVVVTANCAPVVRDGIEGRIVADRDPVALADAIAEIVGRSGQARPDECRRQAARRDTRGNGTASS